MKQALQALYLAFLLTLPVVLWSAMVGCTDNSTPRTTGEVVDDKDLSSRVGEGLSNHPEYKFNDVKVTSYQGTVQLAGFVNTADQKRIAGEVARKVPGVKEVENNISIKEKRD